MALSDVETRRKWELVVALKDTIIVRTGQVRKCTAA